MLTWVAAKAIWASFISWCRERWELLVGVLVGILGMLALTRNNKDMEKVLKEKNKLNQQLTEAEAEARKKEDEALRINLEKYLEANESAKQELNKKLKILDKEKRSELEELLSSDKPENEIAARLKEFLS